jgi:hypothetical protein
MRHRLIAILLLSNFTCSAQSQADYERAGAQYLEFFGTGKYDSMYFVSAHTAFDTMAEKAITRDSFVKFQSEGLAMLHEQFGDMISYKFYGFDENGKARYKVSFSKSEEYLVYSLSASKKIEVSCFLPVEPFSDDLKYEKRP